MEHMLTTMHLGEHSAHTTTAHHGPLCPPRLAMRTHAPTRSARATMHSTARRQSLLDWTKPTKSQTRRSAC